MTRRLISSGSKFEQDMGYFRAVVDDQWVFVSGTTGFNYDSMNIADDLVQQAEQCFQNIQSALRQAGAELTDVVRPAATMISARPGGSAYANRD